MSVTEAFSVIALLRDTGGEIDRHDDLFFHEAESLATEWRLEFPDEVKVVIVGEDGLLAELERVWR